MNKSWEGYKEHETTTRGNNPSEWIQSRAYKIHECKISGKRIYPFENAWCKTFYHYYNGTVAFEEWVCNEVMLFAKIKGEKL